MIEEIDKQGPKTHALSCDDDCTLYLGPVENRGLSLILGVFLEELHEVTLL